MSAKIIPFRITVNPKPYVMEFPVRNENAQMEKASVEQALSELARERAMDVFRDGGKLIHNALARELSRRSGKTIHQSLITRLIHGSLKGKLDTLQPVADAFGISLSDFLVRIRPDSASTTVPSLPPEAAELWALWSQLPRQLRSHFTEQIKNAIAFRSQFPELSAAVTGEALQSANSTRLERQRKRRT